MAQSLVQSLVVKSISIAPGWVSSLMQAPPSLSSECPYNLLVPIFVPAWKEAL